MEQTIQSIKNLAVETAVALNLVNTKVIDYLELTLKVAYNQGGIDALQNSLKFKKETK
jgi:hypothetical protein